MLIRDTSCQPIVYDMGKKESLKMAGLRSGESWKIGSLVVATLINLCLCQGDMANTIHYQLVEEEPTGNPIGDLVTDAALDMKYTPDVIALLHFQFLTDPGISVHIDYDTGMLRTNGRVDREAISGCVQNSRCDVVLDVAVQPVAYFQIFKVIIEVIDINDNTPVFSQRLYEHSLKESASLGSSFIVPSATDKDSPRYGVRTYELHSDMNLEPFVLEVSDKPDGSLGIRIKLVQALDRELQDQYTLSLWGYDGGDPPNSAAMEILVTVEDSNDNDPVFDRTSYEVSVPEDLPLHSTIIQVIAKDNDLGDNGLIEYMFSPQTSSLYGQVFGINPDSGEIYVKRKLDHEMVKVYNLLVTAQDMGPDSQPTDTNVVVHVDDTNDNAPIIIVNTLSISGANSAEIPENAPVGTFVAHVTVTDPDSGLNGQYNCSLTDSAFRLEATEYETEYQIFTAIELDRENTPAYYIALVCTDHGKYPQRAIQDIHVRITDVNDNHPQFTQPSYASSIIENAYQGASVLSVMATDRDIGENADISYTISDNVKGVFAIDRLTGIILAKSMIDHEQVSQYRFYVMATDGGSPSLTASASVVVTVEDVNDEKPLFTQDSYMFSVREDEEPGTLVGTVTAADADSPPYDEFFYSLITGSTSNDDFMVDSKSGRIMVRKRLDRETKGVYQLIVAAKESESLSHHTSTALVIINVGDNNDNGPIFGFPTPRNHTIQISNKVPAGYNITRIRARDADIGRNGQIRYEIQSGNSDNLYMIDPDTGLLYTTVKLTALEYRVTRLQILAKDHGLPESRFELADLTVIINQSIPFQLNGQSSTNLLSNQNLMIVISVACGCAVVAVILIVAIVCIHRQDKLQRARQYNCRIEAIGQLTAKEVLGQGIHDHGHLDMEKSPLDNDLKVTIHLFELLSRQLPFDRNCLLAVARLDAESAPFGFSSHNARNSSSFGFHSRT
ncbi:hypothetical protein LSH36_41g08015 [Paralvinella palmiformis]|uniref:Protocadherin-20 n=1 Tax=Paralvinella palmiformis TaxID=53620 RepID=A0AAD9K7M5_9ANNE|nr:hypothetical protein LSH36_41g08015 [Paralvinella palmiformis]